LRSSLLILGRDSSVRISYSLVSDVSFANRHSVTISWAKPQEISTDFIVTGIDADQDPQNFTFRMTSIATPDSKQSEAYIATVSLFQIFGSSGKEEKVFMRLPSAWRDLWDEFADARKNEIDAADRLAIKGLRALVRQRQDQELEDGVILQGAFRSRAAAARSAQDSGDDFISEHSNHHPVDPDHYRRIWNEKISSPRYQAMLVSIWTR
jgi:ATP-dependent RNA helicase DHX29